MGIKEAILDLKENKRSMMLAISSVVIIILIALFLLYFFFYQKPAPQDVELDPAYDVFGENTLQNNFQNLEGGTPNANVEGGTLDPNNPNLPLANLDSNMQMDPNMNPNLDNNLQNSLPLDSNPAPSMQDTQGSVQEELATNSMMNTMEKNTINNLSYSIKPLDSTVSTCYLMRNGKWMLPKACESEMIESIRNLISANNEIVALEISGVVDNNPYAGPSAELKQEGLASFRAREAITSITRNFSEIAVFEGLSLQKPNKRGFEVKAYYVKK